jgi:hypothetical protein
MGAAPYFQLMRPCSRFGSRKMVLLPIPLSSKLLDRKQRNEGKRPRRGRREEGEVMSHVTRVWLVIVLMVGYGVCGVVSSQAVQEVSPPLRTLLQQRLPTAGRPIPLTVGDARLQKGRHPPPFLCPAGLSARLD